jgi:hypothetical protein
MMRQPCDEDLQSYGERTAIDGSLVIAESDRVSSLEARAPSIRVIESQYASGRRVKGGTPKQVLGKT